MNAAEAIKQLDAAMPGCRVQVEKVFTRIRYDDGAKERKVSFRVSVGHGHFLRSFAGDTLQIPVDKAIAAYAEWSEANRALLDLLKRRLEKNDRRA